jgi:hypothetical protein
MKNSILILGAACACVMYAQPKGGGPPATMLTDVKGSYTQIKNNITRAAEEMPDEGYAFQPTPEERNFGGWVAHVADSQAGSCGAITGMPKQLGAATKTTKADLMAALKESFDMCDAAYDGITDANTNDPIQTFRGATPRLAALYGNVVHDNECYGSMAVYLRLQKLVPPSSQGRGGGAGKGRVKQ